MDRTVGDFVKMFVVIVAVLFVLALLFAVVANASLVAIAWQVYALAGVAYVAASLLAWTGFANLYRYSPTLFVGSPSYRRHVIRSDMWKEGRDNQALVVGVAFGLALMALGAALVDVAARAAAPPEATLGPAVAVLGRQVLCVPVAGLDALALATREALAGEAAATMSPFSGHLTLARSKGRRRMPLTLAGEPVAASWRVAELCLVTSATHPGGSRYTTVARATVPS